MGLTCVLIAYSKYQFSKNLARVFAPAAATFKFSLQSTIRKVFREEITRDMIDYVHTILLDTWSIYEYDKDKRKKKEKEKHDSTLTPSF